MDKYIITLKFPHNKELAFSSEVQGLLINGRDYFSGNDGMLVYDKTRKLRADKVICQYSANTSTLIPALRTLSLRYNPYFDRRDVIESQNNISFYWKPSRLAAFYNRFSTDDVSLPKREKTIRKAVEFLIKTANNKGNFLPEELLARMKEPCKLLGFYEGFPIFDGSKGLPKLLSRIGIHIGVEDIMISTPMDRYATDVEEATKTLEKETGLTAIRKKNRTKFPLDKRVLKTLRLLKRS